MTKKRRGKSNRQQPPPGLEPVTPEPSRKGRGPHAQNRPVAIKHSDRTDTLDHGEVGGPAKNRRMRTRGPAKGSLEDGQIRVEKQIDMKKAEEMKFMKDMLLVMVHETTDEKADPLPTIQVNGFKAAFFRGRSKRVPRFIVERLARIKHTTYTQRLERDEETGDQQYVNIPHNVLVYQFQVLEDPAGKKGADWLQKILDEPQ